MNWKASAFWLLLAAAAGVWLWKGDDWLHLRQPSVDSKSLNVLAERFVPGKVSKVEVAAGTETLVLEKTDAAPGWKLPGNWPLRPAEVEELTALLTGLRTRFQPVAIEPGADLSPYGLTSDQKPVTVKVTADGETYSLAFGEAKPAANEPPFARPAYLRINDYLEVLRLGPDVLPVLRRSPDIYRRRQLFPESERIKLAATGPGPSGAVTATLPGERVTEVAVRFPGRSLTVLGGTFKRDETVVLKRTGPLPKPAAAEKGAEPSVAADRLAEAWEIAAPTRERVDPEKLQKLLAAIPDLWVEEFVTSADKPTGLDKPDRTLTITRVGGEKAVLQIGAVARTAEREESAPSPMIPGLPPMPTTRKVVEEYRYARLAENPQLFLVKGDKFTDLFAAAADLRDATVARFKPEEVEEVTVSVPGRTALRFLFQKGNPQAESATAKADRWVLERKPDLVPVETSAVTDLLRQASDLRASSTDGGDVKDDPAGGYAITVIAREKRAEDQPAAPARTYAVRIGVPKPDPAAVAAAVASAPLTAVAILASPVGPLAVRLDGWPRVVSVTDPSLPKLIERPALAYRRKRLFEPGAKLEGVKVEGENPFVLKLESAANKWSVTEPFAAAVDPIPAGSLGNTLADLAAEEWVEEGPVADLWRFGLDKSKRTLVLALAGGKTHRLELGTAREGKPQVFARLDGGSVLALPANTAEELTKATALGLLDKKLLALGEAAKIQKIQIVRADGKNIALERDEKTGWKAEGLADAPALNAVLALVDALAKFRVDRIADYGPAVNWEKYNLAKPTATLTVTTAGEKPETHTIQLGKSAAALDLDYYLRVDNGPAVGAVSQLSLASALDVGRLDFLDRTLATAEGIDKLVLDRGGKAVTYAKVGGTWKQTAPVEADAESADLEVLAAGLASLRAEKLVADKPTAAELKAFGLDSPSSKWTASANGKGVIVLLLGSKDSTGRVHALIEKGDRVGLLNSDLSSKATGGFRTRKVWDLDEARVDSIEIDRDGKKFKLVRKDASWEDPAAPKDEIDSKAASELITLLGRLRAEAFVGETDEVVKKAGLEKPMATITLLFADKSKRVLVLGGAVEGGKQVHARVTEPAKSEVFVLTEADVAILSRDRAAYLPKK